MISFHSKIMKLIYRLLLERHLSQLCIGIIMAIKSTNNLLLLHNKHTLPTIQEMTLHITAPDGQYQNQTDYILCSQKWRSSIQSAKARPGSDSGSDQELLIAKLRLKLKKVGKTTRQFRYDLNQIPYGLYSRSDKQIQGIRSDRHSA